MNVHDMPTAVTPALFRNVMGRFATGVTVITAPAGAEVRGMTVNAFMSGSLTPPLCIIAIAKSARMHEALLKATHFGVSMLAQGQEAVSVHFAGRSVEGLEVCFERMGGVPVLAGASAAIAAAVAARHDCGDHTLFIGRITDMRDEGRAPLVFQGGRYASLVYPQEPSPYPVIEFW
jgi:flavin reductase (DIM6/NTAB) family NADH-FMN oxidoreductase RutF